MTELRAVYVDLLTYLLHFFLARQRPCHRIKTQLDPPCRSFSERNRQNVKEDVDTHELEVQSASTPVQSNDSCPVT